MVPPSTTATLRALLGQDSVIVQHRSVIRAFGHRDTAAFFEQLLYWSGRTQNPEGWVYKTYAQWEEELLISERPLRRIIERLKEMGLIETKLCKINGAPTLHFRLTDKAEPFLIEAFGQEHPNPKEKKSDTAKWPDGIGQNDRMESAKNVVSIRPNEQDLSIQRIHTKNNPPCAQAHSVGENQSSLLDFESAVELSGSLLDPSLLSEKEPPSPKEQPVTDSLSRYSARFEAFWAAWPKHERKTGKLKTYQAWKKIKPSPDKNSEMARLILQAVEGQKNGKAWRKEGGAYIPMPITWLNGGRWEDEVFPAEETTEDQRNAERLKLREAADRKREQEERERLAELEETRRRRALGTYQEPQWKVAEYAKRGVPA